MSKENKLYKEYLDEHTNACKKYPNDKVFILMQVGKFYESYSTDTIGPNLDEISKLTGVIKSKKGKDQPLNIKFPYCLGFPMVSRDKYCEILVNADYLVIIIDQIQSDDSDTESKKSTKKKREERQITHVYTKGTFIQNIEKNENSYIACAYFSRDIQRGESPLLSVGLTAVDISTGKVLIHEAYSTKYDDYMALDETDRFFTSLNLTEIMIYFSDNGKDNSKENFKEKILSYLKLSDEQTKFITNVHKKYSTSMFQNEVLNIVYPSEKTMVSPLIHFDLEKNIYSNTSMAILFDTICDRDRGLLNSLSNPEFFIGKHNLILGNNAISQLDVIEQDKDNKKVKYRSLFHVVNNTSTALGERFLKERLLSPLTDMNKLNEIYDLTELLTENNLYIKIEEWLKNVRDIERLQRRMELKLLKPVEFEYILESYDNIKQLVDFVMKEKTLGRFVKSMIPSKKSIEKFEKLRDRVDQIFNYDELIKYANLDIDTQIFKKGIHTDLDNLSESSSDIYDFFESMCTELNKLIPSTKSAHITLKKTAKNLYYFKLTTAKANVLKSELEKKQHVIVNGNKYKHDLFKFVETGKSNSKGTFLGLNNEEKYDDPVKCKEQLVKLNRKYYLEQLPKIYNEFKNMFLECNSFISNIDFIKSSAKTAKELGYSRPNLIKQPYGYFEATGLRHPVIERLISHEYVPHDTKIGDKLKGMMIYGLNGIGKSSFMKAVGLAVILAQSGLFVPCSELTLAPYSSLYTRITGDDNIFKGLSSFSLEMVELNAILKRANKKTLVIGDEVCRGTEHISGNSLVASAIIKLSKVESTFIFASHLHEIMEFEEIKEIKTIKSFHLSVTYDKNNGLVFDRTMKEGSGERIYGVTVAQRFIQDKEFIDMAIKFRNKLMDTHDGLLSGKTSKYNKNMFVYECSRCKCKDKTLYISNLETHHINHQKDCENGLVKGKKHLKKNDEANLVVLCNECHDKVHNGSIILGKYMMTSEGRQLQ